MLQAGTQRRLPLSGKRIAITRALPQSGEMREALENLGAEVVEIPCIEIRDPRSWEPLDNAIKRLHAFHFLLITSVNGAKRFLARLNACGYNPSSLRHLEIGAIGPGTAAELARAGVRVDLVPAEYRAEGLLAALENRHLQGKAILIPRARVARDLLPEVLRGRGAQVEVVEAYETAVPDLSAAEFRDLLTPRPDLITFTSSSTAFHFAQLARPGRVVDELAGVAIASIGPVTSESIRSLGLAVSIEASDSTIGGLVQAIRDYFPEPADGGT